MTHPDDGAAHDPVTPGSVASPGLASRESGTGPELVAFASARGYDPVIFDLDGTVVDTVELIRASFHHTVRTVLGHDMPDEELLAGVGQPLMTQMRHLSAEHAQELFDVYREYNHRRHDELVRGYEGVRELLEALRAAGRRIGIVTSKSRDTTEMAFRAVPLGAFFDVVVTASDSDEHKPSPGPLLLCLERLGDVRPSRGGAEVPGFAGTADAVDAPGSTEASAAGEAGAGSRTASGPAVADQGASRGPIYVGDAPVDVEAGRAAGMTTAAVAWGVFSREALLAARPDFYIETPGELLALCLHGTPPAAGAGGGEEARG